MRSAARRLGWALMTLVGLISLLVIVANMPAGRRVIENGVRYATVGDVRIVGLAGRFPDRLRIGRLEVHDSAGLWLTLDDAALDWNPTRLLAGEVAIDRLETKRVAIDRPPAPAEPKPESKGGIGLPVSVTLHALRVERLELAKPVAGIDAALAINGWARIFSLAQGEAELKVTGLDQDGHYVLRGRVDGAGVSVLLSADEPARGVLSHLAGLAELGALSIEAKAEGPLSDLRSTLELTAGTINAQARGTVNVPGQTADLTVTAQSPAFRPRSDLSWESVSLDGRLHGSFGRPTVDATFLIKDLNAGGAAVGRADAEVRGDGGDLRFRAELDGIKLPPPRPELLQGSPVKLDGTIRLNLAARPFTIALRHPLATVDGQGDAGENFRGRFGLKLPDLEPLAAMAGLSLQGSSSLDVGLVTEAGALRVDAESQLAVTGGAKPWPELVGDRAKLELSLKLRGEDLAVTQLRFAGKSLGLSGQGRLSGKVGEFAVNLSLPNLTALAPRVSGLMTASARIRGPLDDFTVMAELDGELATEGWARGPINAAVRLAGLPGAPAGELTARGLMDRAPLELAIRFNSDQDQALSLAIDRADWKSAHAEGALVLSRSAPLPLGKLRLSMNRLEDLRALLGRPLTGSVRGDLDSTAQSAQLKLEARQAGLSGLATADRVELSLGVANPLTHPVVEGWLGLDGLSAGGVGGSARVEASGPERALTLRLSTSLTNLADADLKLNGAAVLDFPAGRVTLNDLKVGWKGEELRLLAPAAMSYRDGLGVDRLRFGVDGGYLEAAGRVAPALDLSLAASRIPARLARLADPGLRLEGLIQADGRLTGTLERPHGQVFVEASGLRQTAGPGAGLPSAGVKASAGLQGDRVQLDARLSAGSDWIDLEGNVPLGPAGELNLRAGGRMDLAVLDPLLTAGGRRVRGRLALDGGIGGTLNSPELSGNLQLADGELQDYGQGLRISRISALVTASDQGFRLVHFLGRAGSGTIRADGSLKFLAQGLPLELSVSTRDARLLSSDRLTVNLNSDLILKGQATRQLEAAGKIRVNRADIVIPEHMPATIAVLDARRPGRKPPPPAPGPEIALNLDIDAPSAIFVRGRGLDAEVGGRLQLRGSAASPNPLGNFEMRRGEFRLAGKTLNFTKGEVGFLGGSLTDPAINFLAETTGNNVTASLAVTGTANKPKISFSSVPELPQDEVLSQLLFGRGTASLSPLEWAQIASAVGSLTGVTFGLGDPLETVRKGLGLDRLSVGAGASGSPTLEAGRYVAPGVYVGAKQGITGAGTQATVQVDVMKGLKLEGSVGTGTAAGPGANAGATSVGVIYQFEY